jgi:hypothetical protein
VGEEVEGEGAESLPIYASFLCTGLFLQLFKSAICIVNNTSTKENTKTSDKQRLTPEEQMFYNVSGWT